MFKLKKKVEPNELAASMGLEFRGGTGVLIDNIAPLHSATRGSLSFSKSPLLENKGAILFSEEQDSYKGAIIVTSTPRLSFIRALAHIEREVGFANSLEEPDVHPSAVIGDNVTLGKGVKIGVNTVIEPNVVLLNKVSIGGNCLIRANTTIGSDGFGFEREPDGMPIKFVHLGGVIIGDNVEIGANTCISRGTLGDTVIEDNVKIDNLVHIAHNCCIREGAFIIACAEISGGVEVGKNAWVAPNASVMQKLSIAENAVVGLGAVVTKSVEKDSVVAGNPAKPLNVKK